jgi:hypothetical protein
MSTADQSKPTHSPPSSPSSSALKKPRTDDLPASSTTDKTPSDNKDGAPAEKQQKKTGKGKKGKRGMPKRVMPDEAIMMDVETFLGKGEVEETVKNGLEWESPLERDQVVELRVSKVGSSGWFNTPLSLSPYLFYLTSLVVLYRRLDIPPHIPRLSQMGHSRPLCSAERAHPSPDRLQYSSAF